MDLVDHRLHRAVAASSTAKRLEPFTLGADRVIHDNDTPDLPVFTARDDIEIVHDRLRPAFLAVANGDCCCIAAERDICVLQTFIHRQRFVALMQDFNVAADLRQLIGIRLENAYPNTIAHHQQIE